MVARSPLQVLVFNITLVAFDKAKSHTGEPAFGKQKHEKNWIIAYCQYLRA